MVAADCVLVPLQCEFYALEGLSQLIKTIERVKQKLNPVEVRGVLTMSDKRSSSNGRSPQTPAVSRQGLRHRDPRNVRRKPSYGMPALLYDIRLRRLAGLHPAGERVLKREHRPLAAERA
jgi:chromosome partitioning protein